METLDENPQDEQNGQTSQDTSKTKRRHDEKTGKFSSANKDETKPEDVLDKKGYATFV